jgi:hypothetical protein
LNPVHTSHPISLRSILILPSYTRLSLPRCVLTSSSSTKISTHVHLRAVPCRQYYLPDLVILTMFGFATVYN